MILAPHTTFQSEEQNQLQQRQLIQAQQNATMQQHINTTSSATASMPTYQEFPNTALNISNDHNVQKSLITEKEKTVFRCPDCSKSFKHASGL